MDCKFYGFWYRCFYCSENLVFYNRFFSIYFHDLLYGDTGGYTGYKGFQGVIGGYKGLQGLRKDYRKLVFQLERLQILFPFFSQCFGDSIIQKIILLLKNFFFSELKPTNYFVKEKKESRKAKEDGRKERKNGSQDRWCEEANILHLDQKTAKCIIRKGCVGMIRFFLARQIFRNFAISFKTLFFWQNSQEWMAKFRIH